MMNVAKVQNKMHYAVHRHTAVVVKGKYRVKSGGIVLFFLHSCLVCGYNSRWITEY